MTRQAWAAAAVGVAGALVAVASGCGAGDVVTATGGDGTGGAGHGGAIAGGAGHGGATGGGAGHGGAVAGGAGHGGAVAGGAGGAGHGGAVAGGAGGASTTSAPTCGDGACGGGEDCATCPGDCGACSATCDDGTCDAGETCTSCPADCGECGPVCGDKACTGGETCDACPADCGPCPPTCGDGACNGGETCQTCKKDCGGCDETGATGKCAFDPKQHWAGAGTRDITFVAFGDPHFYDTFPGCPKNPDSGPDHAPIRSAINSIGQHEWPGGAGFANEGKAFDHVRGVVVAGDLTDTGSQSVPATADCLQYTRFRSELGRCGDEGKLAFPVYALYGNHDFPWNPAPGDVKHHPVIDFLDAQTAASRPGAAGDLYDDPTPGTGHYAWRWDDIWFVNLDVKPGWEVETIQSASGKSTRTIDPHQSTAFLKEFLLSRSNSTTRQIVITAHYPLQTSRVSAAEREAFCRIIHHAGTGEGDFAGNKKLSTTWPVIAYLHGHDHHSPEMTNDQPFTCPAPYGSVSVAQFSVGTPHWGPGAKHPGQVEFTVVRIGKTYLEVLGVTADAANPTGAWAWPTKQRLGYPLPP